MFSLFVSKRKKQTIKDSIDNAGNPVVQVINNIKKQMVDDISTHIFGPYIIKYPKTVTKLKTWTKSKNRWVRRAAAVSFIYPSRDKKFLKDVFAIANLLLTDQDDLVQKGYGWMLKEASKHFPDQVFTYVMKNKKMMPRTALRYSIEKMPKSRRHRAMK